MVRNRFSRGPEVSMCQSDEEMVARCLDGEPEAYRRLVQRHQKSILSFLMARVGSEDLAEEAAQEAFVRAYFSLGKLRKRQSFLPWLLGIAVRAGQELVGRRNRVPAAGDLTDAPAPTEETSQEQPLAKAVARLPEQYQEVISLRFHAGLSCKEIAESLGIPVGNVTKRLSRAYALLREALSGSSRAGSEREVMR